ncbi:uncharacterized protein LOC131621748 [Vicia villosa]|uniref:uncharacterized protein LOC131621748 n=1 Tax=Vicia villosa TaxID=3911 RepID=UPI00273B1750|nr:uncharacterized protein LOC131621748 [Vicia villosa]
MRVYHEVLDEIIHENGHVNIEGELDIVELVINDDFEFEGGEYDDEDADDEFNGGEYDDETGSNGEGLMEVNMKDHILVVDDIFKMNMFNLQNEDVSKLQFGSLEIAYTFYC